MAQEVAGSKPVTHPIRSFDGAARPRLARSEETSAADGVDGGLLGLRATTGRLRGARSEQGGQQIVVRKLAQRRSLETGHGFLP